MRTLLASWLLLGAAACSRDKTSPSQSSSPPSLLDGGGAPSAAAVVASASAVPGPPLPSLDGFEGEIDLRVKENEPNAAAMPFALLVKGGKVRFDVPEAVAPAVNRMVGPKSYAIVDPPAKKLAVVSDEAKQVLLVDMTQVGRLPGMPGAAPGRPAAPAVPKNPAKVTQTGRFDTVAGKKCEEWEVTTDHRESTICVAEQDASFLHVPSSGLPGERMWIAQVFDGRHFPLRMVTYRKDGVTEASRIEVTGVEKKALSPGAFEYPTSYRVTDMAQMVRGAMGMASGMPNFPMPPMPPSARRP
jgi:hypothetical protein